MPTWTAEHGAQRAHIARKSAVKAWNEIEMLRHILKLIEDYVRTYGRRPQVVCLNARHMQTFMAECPDLFDKNTAIPLGFRILVVPESELAEPKVMWLRRAKPKRPALPEKGPALISWTAKPRRRTEA